MADTTIKVRVESADLEAWQRVSGHRGLSQWLRGLANAEIRRLGAESDRIAAENRPVGPPARVLPPEEAVLVSLPTCRHGLVNCRVCGTGVFGYD